MNWIQSTLANLIMRGKITVEIPGLDARTVSLALHDAAAARLRDAEAILCDEALTDREKIDALKSLLL